MAGRSHTMRSRLGRWRWVWPGWWWAIACIACGVALAVGVAWGLKAYGTSFRSWQDTPLEVFVCEPSLLTDAKVKVLADTPTLRNDLRWPIDVPPDWHDVECCLQQRGVGWRWRIMGDIHGPNLIRTVEAGLPLRGLSTAAPFGMDEPLVVGPWHEGVELGGKRYPIRPLWPGFAIDVVFWSALPWVSIVVFRVVRKRRRIRRGLCPRCKYEVGALERCPECGWCAGPLPHGRGS